MQIIDIVLSPALLQAYRRPGALCVVIDVLRASTTIVTALDRGARVIYPIETEQEAKQRAYEGKLVGAERNALRCSFAPLGNDPEEYTSEVVGGRDLYFTTTNGTRTIKRCIESGHKVAVGAFVNLSAIADYCHEQDVLCVCAGWHDKVSLEDSLFAGALVDRLLKTHTPDSDSARMLLKFWQIHSHDPAYCLRKSDHYHRLVAAGKADALPYCLCTDTSDTVPVATIGRHGTITLVPAEAH